MYRFVHIVQTNKFTLHNYPKNTKIVAKTIDNYLQLCYTIDRTKDSSSDRPSREHTQQAGGARADRHKPTSSSPGRYTRVHEPTTAGQSRSGKKTI